MRVRFHTTGDLRTGSPLAAALPRSRDRSVLRGEHRPVCQCGVPHDSGRPHELGCPYNLRTPRPKGED